MLIDIIFAIIMVLAIFKGYRRGLIVGLFSFIAIIIGLAAAMKLSAVVAGYIGDAVNVSAKWLPILSFAIVFLIIIFLVKLGAKAIERTVQFVMLGWVNKLGGIILYAGLYIIVFSVIIFYAEQIHLVKPDTISNSATYTFIQPWGPRAINAFGAIIPIFKDLFEELQHFFDGISKDISFLLQKT